MTGAHQIDLAAMGWRQRDDGGFIGLVGPFWERTAPDTQVHHGFVAETRHINLIGVVQGGMLMTFADRAMGLAAWAAAGDQPCATVQFSMSFVTTARIGSFIEIVPRVIRANRSLIFMDGLLKSAGAELATAQGVWKVVSREGRVVQQT